MTTMLGQQQLMEPEPPRLLIVARGCGTAHFGVDPSTRRLAIACAETRQVCTQSFAQFEGEDAARLDEIYVGTRVLVDRIAHWPAPGIAWVEQPSGRNVNLPLAYAVGAILASLWAGLTVGWAQAGIPQTPPRIEMVPSSSWKKVATGFGRWDKPTRAKLGHTPVFEDYGVARWARLNGYEGASWDEADALGIAEACRRTVRLEER